MATTTRRIDPLSTGKLTVTVKDTNGSLVTGAVATADIRRPTGSVIAEAVAMVNVGNGTYELTIQGTWSADSAGEPVQGTYVALVTATLGSRVHTARIPYLVKYEVL